MTARPKKSGPKHIRAQDGLDPATDPLFKTIRTACSACHAYPNPNRFTQRTWAQAIPYMYRIHREFYPQHPLSLTEKTVTAFYQRYAAKRLASPEVYPAEKGYGLQTLPLGPKERIVAQLTAQKNGLRLVDMLTGEVLHVESNGQYRLVAQGRHPIRAIDFPSREQSAGVLLAELGIFRATDTQKGELTYVQAGREGRPLIQSIGRVADAVVGDFDGDGHPDVAVAVFGWQKTGGLLFW